MIVKEAVKKRRSVRSYSEEELPKETVEEIMNVARLAPSASNSQDWHFVLVSEDGLKSELVRRADCQDFVAEAGLIIAGVTSSPDELMKCKVPYGIVDLSIALDHITLLAAEEGIGTCWIGSFDQDEAKDLLGIPEDCKVVSLMTMGYPKEPLEEKEKIRKPLDSILSWGKYSV